MLVLFSFILLLLLFWLYFVDINVVCKVRISFDRKKKLSKCARYIIFGDMYAQYITVYKPSGLKAAII